MPKEEEKLLGIKEAAAFLNISQNTLRHLITSHKITTSGDDLSFSQKERLKFKVKKSSFKQDRDFHRKYLPKDSPNRQLLTELLKSGHKYNLKAFLAEAILQLMASKALISSGERLLENFIKVQIHLGVYSDLIDALIGDLKDYSTPSFKLVFKPYEDTLGYIYLALKEGDAYYISHELSDLTVATLAIKAGRSFLDVKVGTGLFLLRLLKRGASIGDLYGIDNDPIALIIAKLNLLLNCDNLSLDFLNEHLGAKTLDDKSLPQFKVLLGYPSWHDAYFYLKQGLNLLSEGGIIHFILPESLLKVKAHEKVRLLLEEHSRIKSVRFLGAIFHTKISTAMILTAEKTSYAHALGEVIVHEGDYTYIIRRERKALDFNFRLGDQEYKLLEKIDNLNNCVKLHSLVDFALGIVSGDNKKHLLPYKEQYYEEILRGCDIEPYFIKAPSCFINLSLGRVQQMAPLEFYRAPLKLVYRFIATYPQVAIDTKAYLSLNSCNIMVMKNQNLSPYYLCAILNSHVMRFYFEKKFGSNKILKSQLGQVPIIRASDKTELEIEFMVKELLELGPKASILKAIDRTIADLYGLGKRDYRLAKIL